MTSKYFFLALLSVITLAALNCVGDRAQTANPGPSASQPINRAATGENLEVGDLLDAVTRTYSKLRYYRSKGVNQVRSDFDGNVKNTAAIPFEIEYVRGANSVIKWVQDDRQKVFSIRGKDSWLETDGRKDQTFVSPREGLMMVTLAEGARSLFEIHVFVFRDELLIREKFFKPLVDPEIKGEESVDGHACYMLTGTYGGVEARDTYWVDRESFLIRRIERVIVVRKQVEEKEYVRTTTTTENYSDIELEANDKKSDGGAKP